MIGAFLRSRRQGTSKRTLEFYAGYLSRARTVVGFDVTGEDIAHFLASAKCGSGGKHAYYRTLRAFYNWLYSAKSGHGLNPERNPVRQVDSPKVPRKVLPSLSPEQLERLIAEAESVRDKAIISLLADSGLRLSELAAIEVPNIDWDRRIIRVRCKGNKEGYAPFGQRTEQFLRLWLSQHASDGKLWDIGRGGFIDFFRRLRHKTVLPCNAHTFRRTFATTLAKRGVDSLHIMRLGRWESLAMVELYTRSVKFEDSLKLYQSILS